jgi:hypothetical protein
MVTTTGFTASLTKWQASSIRDWHPSCLFRATISAGGLIG